jgi:hypothetical protein
MLPQRISLMDSFRIGQLVNFVPIQMTNAKGKT